MDTGQLSNTHIHNSYHPTRHQIRVGDARFLLKEMTNNEVNRHTRKVRVNNLIALVIILKHQRDMNAALIHRIMLKMKCLTTNYGDPGATQPRQDGYRGAHYF